MKFLQFILPVSLLILFSCDKETYKEEFESFQLKEGSICIDILCEEKICNNILGDGFSTATINVYVPNNIREGLKKIKVSTLYGSFLENGLKEIEIIPEENKTYSACDVVDEKKILATTVLVSSNSVVTDSIKIEIGDHKQSKAIDFTKAAIEEIKLSANKFAVLNSSLSEATLTAVATRSSGGKPSIGQFVQFELKYDSLGTMVTIDSINNYRQINKRTNENGETSLTFTIGDNAVTGTLFCKACVGKIHETGNQGICHDIELTIKDE